jgi:hypothetical protein
MIQDREPLEADAPRSASTLGADPLGWRFNVDGLVSIINHSLAAVLLVQPLHAEIGNAAFYGAVAPPPAKCQLGTLLIAPSRWCKGFRGDD